MSLPIAITLETLSLLVFYYHLIETLCNACQIIPTISVYLYYSRKDICSCRINAKYRSTDHIGCLQFLVPSNAKCMAWFTHSCRSFHHCHIHGNCGVSFDFNNFNKLIKYPLKPFTFFARTFQIWQTLCCRFIVYRMEFDKTRWSCPWNSDHQLYTKP